MSYNHTPDRATFLRIAGTELQLAPGSLLAPPFRGAPAACPVCALLRAIAQR
jgi:hypothetical protein